MMWRYGTSNAGAFIGWWTSHMVVMTLVWILLVALFIAALRFVRSRRLEHEYRAQDGGILSAITVLQERYARGEIGREEFNQKQHDLTAPPYRDETSAAG
jgi:putative membrane protein